jgi:hypothetical protein
MHFGYLSNYIMKSAQKGRFVCFMLDSDLTNNINNIHPKFGIRISHHNTIHKFIRSN